MKNGALVIPKTPFFYCLSIIKNDVTVLKAKSLY